MMAFSVGTSYFERFHNLYITEDWIFSGRFVRRETTFATSGLHSSTT